MSRYKYCDEETYGEEVIRDTEDNLVVKYLDDACDILNQQDEKIKELEENFILLQNQKAIEELEKIKSRLRYFYHDPKKCLNKDDAIEDFEEVVDKIIKNLKEKSK